MLCLGLQHGTNCLWFLECCCLNLCYIDAAEKRARCGRTSVCSFQAGEMLASELLLLQGLIAAKLNLI